MQEFVFIFVLSLALAMDAFAIAMTLGLSGLTKRWVDKMKAAIFFGFFQGFLFFLGYLSTLIFNEKVASYNKYFAALLLLILGVKMIKEYFSNDQGYCPHDVCLGTDCGNGKCTKTGQYRFLTIKLLLLYAIATSIDAFAAGISFGLLYEKVLLATLSIGIITLILSLIGTIFGIKLKAIIGNKANLIGGIILLLLAIKSLF